MTRDFTGIRIIVADEQATFLETLRMLLAAEGDMAIVGETRDARALPALASELKPDVVLIETALFCGLKSPAMVLPGIRTLVTVPALSNTTVIRAFLKGARAIVPKRSASHVWPESIRTVAAGEYWMGNESIAILVQALRDFASQRTEKKFPKDYRLTAREVEIVDRIAIGNSNREVGQAFSICERTVKHHLTNIFTKVGVSSRLELALFAMNHRLKEAPFLVEDIPQVERESLGSVAERL